MVNRARARCSTRLAGVVRIGPEFAAEYVGAGAERLTRVAPAGHAAFMSGGS